MRGQSWPGHGLVAWMDNFHWQRGVTPASSYQFLAASVCGYLLSVFLVRLVLRHRDAPLPLGPLPALHNFLLTFFSLVMFLGAAQAALVHASVWPGHANLDGASTATTSSSWLFCLPAGTTPSGRLFFWSYVYYLSKFYELLDTFILLGRRKPLTFLHVYHHTLVVIMCFLWLEFSQSLQTIALLTNTGIHVVMYWYYFMCSIGRPPPWKKLVTNGQIVQFLFSFTVSLPFLWLHLVKHQDCSGFRAWTFNVVFNVTLLLLFTNFHRRQYGKMSKKKE